MKLIKIFALLTILSIFSLTGCFTDEIPIKPPPTGSVETGTAEMGDYYYYQIYWDLAANQPIKTNTVLDWDIALDCSPDSFFVQINYSRFTKVYDLGPVDFDTLSAATINGIPEEDFTCDAPDGFSDSTAVGIWWDKIEGGNVTSKKHVYIAYEIKDQKALKFRRKKFMFEGYSGGKYKIRFADPDNKNAGTLEVPKDPATEHIYVSFDSGGSYKSLEPPMEQWDLCFSRFTESLWDGSEFIWYSVVTPIVNSKYIGVAVDSTTDFSVITRDSMTKYTFEYRRNSIGHTWKYYDINGGFYTVDPKLVYILKDTEAFYYKLHFIDFYSVTGEKGYPQFELQRL